MWQCRFWSHFLSQMARTDISGEGCVIIPQNLNNYTFPPMSLLSDIDKFYSGKSDFCIEKANYT